MGAIVTFSILAGLITYSAFFVFCVVSLLRGVTGQALLLACTVTLIWLVTPITSFTRELYYPMEPLAMAAWLVLLVRAMGLKASRSQPVEMRPVIWIFATGISLAVVAGGTALGTANGIFPVDTILAFHLPMLIINLLGLVFIEQLSRNAITDFRFRIRYLNIGLGMMFVFGLIHHALAILIKEPLVELVAIQPAIMALVVPFVIISSLRNTHNRLRLSLSHSFVFHSGVLVASGTLLLLLGLFGYLAQTLAGDIGLTLAVFSGIVAITLFLIIVGSTRFRSLLRVTLSKTFFEYRYDYRDEWMRVTAQLTEPDPDFELPQQAQRAILAVLNAKKSCLWKLNDHGSFIPLSDIDADTWHEPLTSGLGQALTEFYRQYDWVLDLHDMPEVANAISEQLPGIVDRDQAHYLVPMFVEADLFGICLVGPSEIPTQLVWEDFDMLKLIAKQCAGFLALQSANQSLMEQQQLTAVNQMSAFLLHDIKTIAAQLSLMLDNAPKHKTNPKFVDDMLVTTKNSVDRMERIIAGLRDPQSQTTKSSRIDLSALLRERASKSVNPKITYVQNSNDAIIRCDVDDLNNALTHLEKNALEAIDDQGTVQVSIQIVDGWALLRIADTGHGMSDAFLKNDLFRPFRSSKGITGMGIGAYQAREKIRGCGGDLQVESKVGVGTTFTIKLPLALDE